MRAISKKPPDNPFLIDVVPSDDNVQNRTYDNMLVADL